MTAKAKSRVEESEQAIAEFKDQLQDLEADMAEEIQRLNDHWAGVADQIREQVITPLKKDIYIDLFGLAWMPCWLWPDQQPALEEPGYAPGS
jgi:hypothetical protein